VDSILHEKTADCNVEMTLETDETNLPAYLAVALGVFCIGSSAIFVKIANVEGVVSAFYRLFFAALVVVPFWVTKRPAWPNRQDALWIVLGGVFFALDLVLWNTGILLTSAATATLLANNAPLWVGLGAMLLFREKLSAKFWIGLFIAASLFYAAYLLATQKARKKVDTLTFTCLSMVTGVVILFPVSVLSDKTLIGFSSKTWLALLGLGLFSQLTGWLAINKAFGRLRAAPVSVCLLLQPVVTAILGIIFLGESLQTSDLFGGTLVLVGVFFVNQR